MDNAPGSLYDLATQANLFTIFRNGIIKIRTSMSVGINENLLDLTEL